MCVHQEKPKIADSAPSLEPDSMAAPTVFERKRPARACPAAASADVVPKYVIMSSAIADRIIVASIFAGLPTSSRFGLIT